MAAAPSLRITTSHPEPGRSGAAAARSRRRARLRSTARGALTARPNREGRPASRGEAAIWTAPERRRVPPARTLAKSVDDRKLGVFKKGPKRRAGCDPCRAGSSGSSVRPGSSCEHGNRASACGGDYSADTSSCSLSPHDARSGPIGFPHLRGRERKEGSFRRSGSIAATRLSTSTACSAVSSHPCALPLDDPLTRLHRMATVLRLDDEVRGHGLPHGIDRLSTMRDFK